MRFTWSCLALLIACGDPPPPPPPARPPPAPAPPSIPELAALGEAPLGEARITVPRWDRAHDRYGHEVIMANASMGTVEGAARIALVRGEQSMMLTYYGPELAAGSFEVAVEDEASVATRRAAGTPFFVARMSKNTQIAQSRSGTVTITAADHDHVAGTYDLVVSGPLVSGQLQVRGRFDARRDREIDAFLEHQQGVSERIRNPTKNPPRKRR